MKQLFTLLILFSISSALLAQNADTASVGKIVYFEGKVDVGVDPNWTKAKINGKIKRNQSLRTGAGAMAEIVWNNGTKTVVGGNSLATVKALQTGSTGKSKGETESIFSNFQNAFKTGPGAKRSQEGGIRRSQKKGATRDDVYWKQEMEISFDEAYTIYEQKEYAKAIAGLQAFLQQKPNDAMAPFAQFALGHSYIMSNNELKAREVFEDFILRFPNDPLREEAEKVVTHL